MLSRLIKRSEFTKNIFILIVGTITAQALPILLSPILSRLFEPKDFAVYGIYMSIVTVLLSISIGAYEFSIVLPKKDEDSLHLLAFSVFLSITFCLFLFILIFLFHNYFLSLLKNPALDAWLYLIPLSVLLFGILNILTYWFNRKKEYKQIAINKVNKNWGLSISQLVFGLLKLKTIGLIIGQIIGDLIATIFVIFKFFKSGQLKLIKSIFSFSKTKSLLKEYKKFPLYILPTVFMNSSSSQILTLLVAAWFNPLLTGAYYFALRLLSAPMALIGASVTQTYFQRFTEIINEGKENPKPFLLKIWKMLFAIAIIPSTILFIWGKSLFIFVFGQNWGDAGIIASIMAPMILFTFISSPTSSSFMVIKKQNYNLFFGIFEFIFRISCFYIGYYYNDFYLGLKILVVIEMCNVVLYNTIMWLNLNKFYKAKIYK